LASGPVTSTMRGLLALTGDAGPLAWTLSIALLGVIAVESLRLLPRDHRHHFVGVWAVWIFCVLVAPTPLRLHHEGWVILAAVALATLWIAALVALDTSFEERAASTGVWLTLLYTLTFTWHMDRAAAGATTAGAVALVMVATASALVAVLALP